MCKKESNRKLPIISTLCGNIGSVWLIGFQLIEETMKRSIIEDPKRLILNNCLYMSTVQEIVDFFFFE